MELTERQERMLDAVRAGVGGAADFMARLTEYRGAPVETEYLITVEIARALLEADYKVAFEYMPRQVSRSLAWDDGKTFDLGTARFDIAAHHEMDPHYIFLPTLLVEAKIGVRKLGGKLEADLNKVVAFMDGLKPNWAQHVLAAFVFQVHRGSARPGKVALWRRRADETEALIRHELESYARHWPGFEFEMRPLYGPGGGAVDDEILYEPDGSGHLGQPGHVARCNTILVRRPPPLGTPLDPLAARLPWKRETG